MENRHAYLILVHNQPKLLQVLIDMIDDERNDIFIHVDVKADLRLFSDIHAESSRITYTKKRVKISWSEYSMVEAEYVLLETAKRTAPYSYYHLLSGSDLPLKNQDYIHNLFDNVYRGEEFVGFCDGTNKTYRTKYYWYFVRYMRSGTSSSTLFSRLREYGIRMQKRLGVSRNKQVSFLWGPQWFSITDELCEYLIAKRKTVRRLYRMTMNPDESFVQTIVSDSPFIEKVHDRRHDDDNASCMRLIDWNKEPNISSPHTWTRQDWKEIIASDMLFARKFSEKDMDFVYCLKDHVLSTRHDE